MHLASQRYATVQTPCPPWFRGSPFENCYRIISDTALADDVRRRPGPRGLAKGHPGGPSWGFVEDARIVDRTWVPQHPTGDADIRRGTDLLPHMLRSVARP